MGKSLVEYWLEHLVARGAKDVSILCSDRSGDVRALIGDGARWGLKIEVVPEGRELSSEEARLRHRADTADGWLDEPDDAILMDHLPGRPEKNLFASYAHWFAALLAWREFAATPDRIGLRKISPGVWVGLHARVAPSARLIAPCWIGANVSIGAEAVIGPEAILEDRVMVETGARIARSAVAPETFVGRFTLLDDSLAFGPLLINWKNGSCLRVPDAFLLCALKERQPIARSASRLRRLASLLASKAQPSLDHPALKEV